MIDFRHIVDFIFKNKDEYKKASVEDKEYNFFIINRKFARMYPKHSHFFNSKYVSKSIAMDLWYFFFIKNRTVNIPDWYWKKASSKKENIKKTTYSKDQIDFVCKIHDITENDFNYLLKNYPSDIEEEIDKYKKYNKKE